VTTGVLDKTVNQLAKSERQQQQKLQNQISQLKSSIGTSSGLSRKQRQMLASSNPYMSGFSQQSRGPNNFNSSVVSTDPRFSWISRNTASTMGQPGTFDTPFAQREEAIHRAREKEEIMRELHANMKDLNDEDPMDPASRNKRLKTGIREGVYASEAKSVSDMLTAWDKFTINRAFPGVSVSPYVNNMCILPLPTGTFKTSLALSTCYSITAGASQPLGTNTYTVIMFCPSLSSYLGPGGGGLIGATTRLAGYVIYQTNSLNSSMTAATFSDSSYALPASQLYGSDFSSIGTGGFVWSCAQHIRLITPQANLVGSCYKGMITLAQLGSGLTQQNLIQDATVTATGAYENTLRSAVQDPALVMDINANAVNVGSSRAYPECENEVISYIVYQTPAISVTSGASTPFTLILNMEGNFVYYPKATDPIALNVGTQESRPAVQDANMRHSYVSQTMSSLGMRDIADSNIFKSAWNGVSDWMTSMLPKAVGSGLKWLDNRVTGGAVQSFDTKVLGGAVQHSLGLKTDREEQTEDFLKQLENLKMSDAFGPSRATSMFNGGSANMQSSVAMKPYQPAPTNGLVPKSDFVYWFHQLDEVLARRRGTVGQTVYLDQISSWVNSELDWYDSQPDWVDEFHVRPIPELSPDKRRSIEKIFQRDNLGKRCVVIPTLRKIEDTLDNQDNSVWGYRNLEKPSLEEHPEPLSPTRKVLVVNDQQDKCAESFEELDTVTGKNEFKLIDLPLRKVKE
jgi:hypothetical protein